MRAKIRALGQHFLADRHVLGKILAASALGKDEIACEAGTGNGILTAELCKHARHVISYEVDRKLYEKARLKGFENLQLVNADLFKVNNIEFDVFVSNLPYSRSRDALQWLATTKQFKRAIVMVQREFANKISARPGDENYRAISAICSYCFEIERLFGVSKDAFTPPPKVESEVIRLVPISTINVDIVKKINVLFSQRSKKATRVAAKMGIPLDFGDRKIDQLMPEEIMRIAG